MRNQQAHWVHEAQNIASGTMQRWQQVKHWSETSEEVRLDDLSVAQSKVNMEKYSKVNL